MSKPVEYPLYRRIGKGGSKAREQVGVALVDGWAVEYLDENVGAGCWQMFHGGKDTEGVYYAKTVKSTYVNGKRICRMLMMHTFLLRLVDPEGEFQADGLTRHAEHTDRNPLNNTVANLRWATQRENMANRAKNMKQSKGSRYKGVFPTGRKAHPWRARTGNHRNGNRLEIGSFKSEEDAARAYNAVVLELYGEFAVLNVIDQEVTA